MMDFKFTDYITRNNLIHVGTGFLSFCVGFILCYGLYEHKYNKLKKELELAKEKCDVDFVSNYKMESGYTYTGYLCNGRRFGYGYMVTPKGTVYEGSWVNNDIVNGTMKNGRNHYTGDFNGLSPDGYGMMSYSDNSYYKGGWCNGAKSGIGIRVDSLGNKSFGRWINGIIDKSTANSAIEDKVWGIDLSHHNYIDEWDNIALYRTFDGEVYRSRPSANFILQPINFVFVKATEGANHRDKRYVGNMLSAKKHGIVRGSYHFMHLTSSSPEQQADNFLDFIIYEKGDLPPVLDIEVADQARRIGVEETQERVLKWLEIVERKLGTRPIIYTSASMKKDFFDARKFSKYKFWIAHYRNEPPSDFNYLIWQCTDKGNIYGLEHTHKIDINIFNGTYRDFITLLDN